MSQHSSPGMSTPARLGCYLGLVTALIMLGSALYMLAGDSDTPMPLAIAFLVTGTLQAAVCTLALERKRAAWAFALSLNGTLSVTFLFGAPKVRDGLDVSLSLGLLPATLFAVVTTLLALGAEDY